MKRKITGGLTSVSLALFIQDTTSTTGGGLSGLTHSTSGLVAEYRRAGQSAWTTITLASKTLGTWTSGGFVEDGSRAGYYELDLPNAAVASGSRFCLVRLYGAANMLDVPIEIELDVVDYQTARFGASDGTGVMLAANQDVRNVLGTLPAVTLATSQPNYAPATAAQVEAAIVDELSNRNYEAAFDNLPTIAEFEARTLPAGSYFTTLGTNAPSGWINAASFASGAITSNVIAADAVAEIQSGLMLASSYIVPDNVSIANIKLKTDNLPSDPADQSAVELAITNASNAITSLINALNNISAADVNAEILDVLQTDTFSELTGPPAANSSLKDKITYLFMWAKNKATQTSSERKLYADDGTTVVSTELVSDDNTTFIKNKAQ